MANNKWVEESKFITYNESIPIWDDPKSLLILKRSLLDIKGLAKLMKYGVPDDMRVFVYSKLLQVETGLHEFEKDFNQSQRRTHGAVIPETPVPPSFEGRISYDKSLALTPEGIIVSDHILCILANDFPNLTFAPSLPAICYLLTHFAQDNDQLLGLMVAITKINNGGKNDSSSLYSNNSSYSPKDVRNQSFYFPSSVKDSKILSRAFGNLLYKKSKKLHSHVKKLHSSLPRPFWDKWFSDFFIDIVPQQALWKILDGYILTGYTYLFKFALALLLQYQKDVLKLNSMAELDEFFNFKSAKFSDPKCLLGVFNAAEKIAIKIETSNLAEHHPSLSKFSSEDLPTISKNQRGLPKFISSLILRSHKIHSSNESDESEKKVDLLSTSTVLQSDYWIALWSWIPQSKQLSSIQLVFTTREHGSHISTLYRLTQDISPMILIIETTNGRIFGAYLSQPWSDSDGQYYGNGETFLFTLAPSAKLYPWVGRFDVESEDAQNSENVTSYGTNLFVQSGGDFLNIGAGGSGIGLHLDEMLSKGETSHCKTFGNDPLTGDKSNNFTIFTVEVFAFV